MKEYKYKHTSKSDGLEISVLRIEPDNPEDIKGIVQLVHGMNEYKERYLHFIYFLVEKGYLCVIHDHRGHGESIKCKEDLGYMYEGGYEAFIEDTHEITLEIKEYAKELTKKELPFTLLGHSMGSMVARCYLKKYDDELNKLVVIGCPSKKPGMVPGLALIRLIKLFKGERARDRFIAMLIVGDFEKRFKEDGPNAWINSNPEEVKKYRADPFCRFLFTINGYENLVRLTMLTYKDGGYVIKNPALPIRFFSGAEDPCAVNEKAFNKAIALIKKQGYSNVEGKMYEGLRHEILNEVRKEEVYAEILSFIES